MSATNAKQKLTARSVTNTNGNGNGSTEEHAPLITVDKPNKRDHHDTDSDAEAALYGATEPPSALSSVRRGLSVPSEREDADDSSSDADFSPKRPSVMGPTLVTLSSHANSNLIPVSATSSSSSSSSRVSTHITTSRSSGMLSSPSSSSPNTLLHQPASATPFASSSSSSLSSSSSSTSSTSAPYGAASMNLFPTDDRASESDAASRNLLRSKYSKKIRRNATASRSLSKFKRIKQHKLQRLTRRNDDELYDGADDDHRVSSSATPIMYRLSAFCTCDSYLLSDIIEALESSQSDMSGRKLTLYNDVLHIKQKLLRRDVFIFTYGCVVFFNWPEKAEQQFISNLRYFAKQPLQEYDMEDFDFMYSEVSSVSNDALTLSSRSSLEKLSVSFALAQCVKLSIYEERIAREIDANKHLPQMLASTGSIGMTRAQIGKKIGALFIERNNVNLHFDVLDSPEFFWEQDKYKHVYDRLFNYLELGKRVDLLNKRLDIMKELLDILNEQLEHIHAHKLEWIIIWLIVFEVIVIVFWNILLKDILGFFPRSETD